MNPISIFGAFIITFALLFYGVGSITLQRFKMVSRIVFWFLLIGIVLDFTAITCMIIGAQGTPFTPHGLLGYSAFLVMFVYFILVARLFWKEGRNARINKSLERYAKFAYAWWVIAYFTGFLLVML